jgi:hypothetical protein
MASFPGSKVHRVSRRKLGRGQTVQMARYHVSVINDVTNVIFTFDVPVVVRGPVNINITGGFKLLDQFLDEDGFLTQVYDGDVTGAQYDIKPENEAIRTYQGATGYGAAGTF